MTLNEIEIRMKEISDRLETAGEEIETAEVDQLTEEARGLTEARAALIEEARKEEETRKLIAEGKIGEVKEEHKEDKKMSDMEIRNGKEYIDAYAEYIKTGDDRECRSLLTTNASGDVPVPVLVDEIVRTAWEKNEILNRVRKTNFRGNLKVAFEKSADPAYVHTEGQTAHTEESLELGIVTMVPANIKKWIRLSDEAVTMGGEPFLRYVYEELTYQIMKKLADDVVGDIIALDTSNGDTAVGAKKITEAPGLTTVATAFANLSDEATDCVIIMNKLTYATFKAAYAAGNFAVDPFEGMPVLFSGKLPAYSTASDNAVYAIVGDLKGEQVNYPEGEGVVLKYDDKTEAERDLVKIVGRQYAAHAATAPFRFTNIAKPAAATST